MKNKQDAQLAGDKRYQGVPCKNGHSGVRFVVNADCVECAMYRQRTTSRKEYLVGYRKNSEKLKTYQVVYQKAYEQTQKVKEVRAQYRKNNAGKWTAKTRRYQIAKDNRTPNWLTWEDHWMIEEVYDLAVLRTKLFGFKWHVDHIIPLQGELASGLHVLHNLQVIPASDNLSKSNQFTIS
jgi:hypothetical protein